MGLCVDTGRVDARTNTHRVVKTTTVRLSWVRTQDAALFEAGSDVGFTLGFLCGGLVGAHRCGGVGLGLGLDERERDTREKEKEGKRKEKEDEDEELVVGVWLGR